MSSDERFGMTVIEGDEGGERREGTEYRESIGAWVVTYWWPVDAVSGGPRAISIEAAPDADPQEVARGVSSTVLRQVNIANATKEVEPVFASVRRMKGSLERSQEWFADLLKGGVSDEYLAALSAQYVISVDAGHRAPIQDLVMWTGKNQATLKGHLREARKRDLLTKVEGKAGGQMTEKAVRLLEGVFESGTSLDQPG